MPNRLTITKIVKGKLLKHNAAVLLDGTLSLSEPLFDEFVMTIEHCINRGEIKLKELKKTNA